MDGRTGSGRRRLDLIDAFTAALGGASAISEAKRADIQRAAELTLIAEEARAAALKKDGGAPVDLAALVRIEGAADRAVRRLGIKPGGAPAHIPLRERLARDAAGGD